MDASPTMPAADPGADYARRLAASRAAQEVAAIRGRRLAAARLGTFAGLVALVGLVGAADWSPHVLWPVLALFAVLVTLHAVASQHETRARRAGALYEDGLARLDGTWPGRGETSTTWAPPDHLYAADLDLFGRGSLFELLCTARTDVGRRRLAAWLLAPADPATIRGRQEAVAELRPGVAFREDLALLESDVRSALEHAAVSAWGSAPARLSSSWLPWLHAALGLASATLLTGWLAAGWSPLPMLAVMLVQFLAAAPLRMRVQEVLAAADRPARDLALVGRVLERIEGATFSCAHLRGLQARLAAAGRRPSGAIRRLARRADFAEARLNQIFLPVSWLFSLGTQLAFALEAWRAGHGPHVPIWLDVVGELEALVSLSGYAYEHPADPFPTIEDSSAPLYAGAGLGHPLLPAGRCVANDVHLQVDAPGIPQGLVVSGSNMSGKSTLLRTVGVNAVLAQAGAPVRAASLRLTPLSIGASIRLQDSLQEGASRFYAEIGRLRRVVDASVGARPALFLLDEILHGTNSHDRRIGAQAVVRTLLDNGALGLVTTHDLALAAVADASGGRLANVHFEDHLEGDRIAFDYRLKPGVVTHSNALALMRAVGLHVDGETTDGR